MALFHCLFCVPVLSSGPTRYISYSYGTIEPVCVERAVKHQSTINYNYCAMMFLYVVRNVRRTLEQVGFDVVVLMKCACAAQRSRECEISQPRYAAYDNQTSGPDRRGNVHVQIGECHRSR